MKNEVGFGYGCLSDSLEQQANEQGYTLVNNGEMFEKIKESINVCMFHVATSSQVDMMTKKLHKKVIKALKPLEEDDKSEIV